MTFFITNALAVTNCNDIVDAVDAGSGAGKAKLYDGTAPADADTALSGNTLLAENTMSDPAFGNAVDTTGEATATANAITDDTSADATGTATFVRLTDSDDNVVCQMDVGAEVTLNSAAIQSGAKVEYTSMTVAVPE